MRNVQVAHVYFKQFADIVVAGLFKCQILTEPVHEISNNEACATSKASDQPAHMRSLIRAFARRLNIILVLSY